MKYDLRNYSIIHNVKGLSLQVNAGTMWKRCCDQFSLESVSVSCFHLLFLTLITSILNSRYGVILILHCNNRVREKMQHIIWFLGSNDAFCYVSGMESVISLIDSGCLPDC